MSWRLPAAASVTLLFGINLVNYMDRWTVAGVLPELQDTPSSGGFGITDAQGGLLTSIFVLTYMLLSPIFGFLGDRVSRKRILVTGVTLWSAATFLSSFTAGYHHLLACRALVGVGEASYATIAPTLIADLYPAEVRTRWLSLYFVAVPLGSALGFIVGGTTSVYLGWRWAFRFTPVIGLALTAILHSFMDEPARGQSDAPPLHTESPTAETFLDHNDHLDDRRRPPSPHPAHPLAKPPSPSVAACGDFFRDARDVWRTRSFLWSTLGLTSSTFVLGALAQWTPTFLQRVNCNRGVVGVLATADEFVDCRFHINIIFGLISCATGIGGTLLGAALSTRYSTPTNPADAFLCGAGLLAAAPAIFLALQFAPVSISLTWLMMFLGELAVSITWAPVTAMLLYVVAPRKRGLASGMQTLFSHLFGDATSPVLVGLLADHLHVEYGYARSVGLQRALYPTAGWAVTGAMFFFVATFYVVADRAAVGGGAAGAAAGAVAARAKEADGDDDVRLGGRHYEYSEVASEPVVDVIETVPSR